MAVHLGKEKHLSDEFKAVNPQQLVPALDTGSDAIGDATTGLIPPFNIIGDERADPPNRGAW